MEKWKYWNQKEGMLHYSNQRTCTCVYFLGRGKGIHSCRGLTKGKKNSKEHLPQSREGCNQGRAIWRWAVSAKGTDASYKGFESHFLLLYPRCQTAQRSANQWAVFGLGVFWKSHISLFSSSPCNSRATSPLNEKHCSYAIPTCGGGEANSYF